MKIESIEIEEACEQIEANLHAFGENPARLEALDMVRGRLQWLRERYPKNQALFEQHADRIKTLGIEFNKILQSVKEQLAGEYLEANQVIHDWRNRQEICRNLLVQMAKTSDVDTFESERGTVKVGRSRSLSLPKPGTPDRDALAALITDSGNWPEVGIVNAARLKNAIDLGLFSPEQAAQLTSLCPEQESFRLTVRHDDKP